ncbi:MAG: UPF0182 family protein, partial [Anaerolineae bacterium]|nr:UPF0182 family protein [Anaerolineae bacterium]
MGNRGWLIGTVVIVALVIVLFVGLDLYTDLVWLDTLGVASVLWRRLVAENLLFVAAWVVATLFLAANWWLARRMVGGGQMAVPWLEGQRTRAGYTAEPTARVVAARVANTLLFVLAVVVGLFFALPAKSMWLQALMSSNAVPFGEVDPILGRDLSFYVFRLPWLQFLQGWFLWLLLAALAGAALVYLASFSAERLAKPIQVVDDARQWLRLTPAAQRHMLVLGAVALGFFAWGYQLNIPSLLYSSTGAAYGAGYADVHARLPVMHVLTAIVALGAGILLASLFVRVRWLPYAALGVWLLVAFVGGSIYPSALQRLVVVPNELTREREYISHTIEMTRAAYGLASVTEDDFEAAEEAVPVDLEANQGTIMNIRLWDYRPLLRTYAQLQEIRLYYAFTDVDIDRYHVDGDYRQVTLAVREISYSELPAQAQTWVNRHLVYTHGYGLVLSPVNEVREEGLPVLWVRDIPPRSLFPELALSRPEIYFGELTEEYVVVNTEEQELDYPAGDQNVYTTYEGTGGVVLDSALKRLAYSMRLGSSQILLSGSITPESRLLWLRAIRDRVDAVAPFLAYDPDPYAVILNGRLVWLLDAYTTSDRYPYSDPISTSYGRLNYIRNSVKVTMDAYDGSLAFYLIDPSDPVAATYAAIFPDLFHPVEEMDPQLVAHWRYPEGLFRIQAAKFQSFHMTEPQVFYNQEDLWSWAEELAADERMLI